MRGRARRADRPHRLSPGHQPRLGAVARAEGAGALGAGPRRRGPRPPGRGDRPAAAVGGGLVVGPEPATARRAARRDRTADLREAVEALSGTPSALEAARAQLSLGRSRAVADGEAVSLLGSALGLARACGATAVAREAVTALAERDQAPTDVGTAPVGLTSRQRRVRDLVATGLGVNEVAQRLFLTPGTVRTVIESLGELAPSPGSSAPQVEDGTLWPIGREDRHGS